MIFIQKAAERVMQGQQVSHYRLLEKLGAGTYGEVWKGVHVHDNHLCVAIKLLHAALATDDAFLTALKAECRVLSRLHHPNIVGFRDLALSDAHPPAMVLELVAGGSLEDHLAAGPQPVDSVVAILDAMLAGLGHAHTKGVVHRDIKPSNVLLDSDDAVRLVDFGIARAADSGNATKTGVLQGTLDYIAPEVVHGRKAGPAADVYAAGLVAWELLSGRRACADGPPGTKLGWHIGVGLPDVRTERPDCPAWLAEVVASLGAKHITMRPADGAVAQEMLQARGVLPDSPGGPSRRVPAPEPAPAAPNTVQLSTAEVASSLLLAHDSQAPDTSMLPRPKPESAALPNAQLLSEGDAEFKATDRLRQTSKFWAAMTALAAVPVLGFGGWVLTGALNRQPTAQQAPSAAMLESDPSTTDLGSFRLNLAGPPAGQILEIQISIETSAEDALVIPQYNSRIRNAISLIASDLTAQELDSSDEMLLLRDEVHRKINAVLPPEVRVYRVYFTEFILQ